MKELTLEEKATNYATMQHIERVRNLLNVCIQNLLERGEKHDQSKLDSPEVELLTQYTPLLQSTSYGSPENNEHRAKMKVGLDSHYAKNRHHPEHFKQGIVEMNLIDLLEVFCDWKASSERQHGGNLRKSIEINANRYGMSPQLVRIFENTADYIDP